MTMREYLYQLAVKVTTEFYLLLYGVRDPRNFFLVVVVLVVIGGFILALNYRRFLMVPVRPMLNPFMQVGMTIILVVIGIALIILIGRAS